MYDHTCLCQSLSTLQDKEEQLNRIAASHCVCPVLQRTT